MDKNLMLQQLVARFDTDEDLESTGEHGVWPVLTDSAALDAVYKLTVHRFPKLYEKLLLSYRWLDAETDVVRFWSNPRGAQLNKFIERLFIDKFLTQFCLDNGLIPFGSIEIYNYDPVCFDCRGGIALDRPVVQLCHESILVGHRIKVIKEVAPSFQSLVLHCIEGTTA